jgi:hypothetical protein
MMRFQAPSVQAMQVPAESIIAKSEPAPLNQALLKGVSQTFSGTPEMRLTDTGIDDTLLSFVRCAVAAETQLLAAGWSTSWVQGQPGGSDDLPLDVMAKLVTPVDFNTEARVSPTWMWHGIYVLGLSAVSPDNSHQH